MFKKGTAWLFKGLFSLLDVSLKIRKEGFYLKLLFFLSLAKTLSQSNLQPFF